MSLCAYPTRKCGSPEVENNFPASYIDKYRHNSFLKPNLAAGNAVINMIAVVSASLRR